MPRAHTRQRFPDDESLFDTGRPIVAIVGRPNVGKSTIFNRLTGLRTAVVLDMPGVTRDRHYGMAEWGGRRFRVIDTGGFELDLHLSPLLAQMREQVMLAIAEADAVLFLMDVRELDNPVDRALADLLRRGGKPVLPVVNKCDNPAQMAAAYEASRLGLGTVYPVSAQHGANTGDMLDALVDLLPPDREDPFSVVDDEGYPGEEDEEVEEGAEEAISDDDDEEEVGEYDDDDDDDDSGLSAEQILAATPSVDGDIYDETKDDTEEEPTFAPAQPLERPIRMAIIGRQNVGKSTLVNRLLGEERVIASPIAGTTRDAIDTAHITPDGQRWILIDTAGIRRRGKVEYGVEGLSVLAAMLSMERADVAVLLIDATEGLTEQDAHIAGHALERGCCVIIGVNKWDAVEKDGKTADQYAKALRQEMGFLEYAPILFLSAKTGQRATKIFELAKMAVTEGLQKVNTGALNRWLKKATTLLSPPIRRNRRLKPKYAVQTGVLPPRFTLFVNDPQLIHFSYFRYLINSLRQEFAYKHVPLRLQLRKKADDVDQRRPKIDPNQPKDLVP